MLTEEGAIEIAKTEFERHGHSASDYDLTIETYAANNGEWIVWFELKGEFKIPGGKHAVLVDKATGRSVFMAGE
jgi:hypothetical protein